MRKMMLLIFGVLFIGFGISAFFGVPGGHEASHHTIGHNITHIVGGVLVMNIALAGDSGTRRSFCFVFGAIYLAIGLFGVFSIRDSLRLVPGIIEFHLEDHWVQLGTGMMFVALGLLKKVPEQFDQPALAN